MCPEAAVAKISNFSRLKWKQHSQHATFMRPFSLLFRNSGSAHRGCVLDMPITSKYTLGEQSYLKISFCNTCYGFHRRICYWVEMPHITNNPDIPSLILFTLNKPHLLCPLQEKSWVLLQSFCKFLYLFCPNPFIEWKYEKPITFFSLGHVALSSCNQRFTSQSWKAVPYEFLGYHFIPASLLICSEVVARPSTIFWNIE